MTLDDSAFVVRLDLDAIRLRSRRAVDSAIPASMSAADVPLLVSEVERLGALVIETRLAYDNLRAAARAALSAARDGEPEPIAYLVDELYGAWPTFYCDRGRR
jgi:hypothetical protein